MDVKPGDVFKQLTVVSVNGSKCLCACSCGNQKEVPAGKLIRGDYVSCGCYRRRSFIERSTKHGHASSAGPSREYYSWQCAQSRCTNSNDKDYKNYGGRGISFCERWSGDGGFERFLEDMGPRPDGHTLDRKDTNGNYEPSNCRWATEVSQQRNRRSNKLVTYNGKTQPLISWTEELGISYDVSLARLKNGWSVESTFERPVAHKRRV